MNPNIPTLIAALRDAATEAINATAAANSPMPAPGVRRHEVEAHAELTLAINAVEAALLPPVVAESGPAHADSVEASSVPAAAPLTAAVAAVLAERQRQVDVELFTAYHDDEEHEAGQLCAAASAYALAAADALSPYSQGDGDYASSPPSWWPWDEQWWKPGDPRRMLVKAGALILAEIERIDRTTAASMPATSLACPHCHGSGEAMVMSYGHGPDDYEELSSCPHCNGTGEVRQAAAPRPQPQQNEQGS